MNIKDFEHLQKIPEIKFKTESNGSEDVIIAAYMLSSDELWNIPLAKECRGITFNSSGEVICRPFEKFFNMNERPETQLNIIKSWDWDKVIIAEKKDGSMVSPVLIGDEIHWKTKKSFYSDVALSCSQYAEEFNILSDGKFYEAIKWARDKNKTLIFEYTSPDNRIVLDYGDKPNLTLLAVRDNQTGKYVDPQEFFAFFIVNINTVPTFKKSLDEILFDIDNKKDFEGYVLFNTETQERVKIKTKWYLQMHRVNTELRVRDVVSMVLDETIDDVKSIIIENGLSLDPIHDIEHQVRMKFEQIIESTKQLAFIGKDMERKEFALQYRHHSYFGLAIKEIEGRDADYKKYFVNNYLKEFSLRGVYNVNFGQGDEQ